MAIRDVLGIKNVQKISFFSARSARAEGKGERRVANEWIKFLRWPSETFAE